MKVAIVTDSTSDIPVNMAKERRITIVPLHIQWGNESLTDGVDILPTAFYERLKTATVMPTTSQPSAGEFVEKFKQARELEGADGIVCITLSKALSGTYASAEAAAGMVDFPVKLVDSKTSSLALGFTVLAAADARDQGKSLNEIASLAEAAAKRTSILFTVNTLEFLHRGGRIGGAQRFIGTALSIKPILHVKEGVVAALESVRTRKKAIARLMELIKERATTRPIKIGVVHSHPPDLEELKNQIQEMVKPDMFLLDLASPIIGVHIGPEAVGVAIMNG